ncbi:AMP-binding protein [Panacagrimonas sp.]|uniref:AMP-binding protein n=1 Tax=Panacagrimonas sp. TaxID=2480088 RepID=UPI003B51D3B4
MTHAIELAAYPEAAQARDPRIPPRDQVVTRDLIERWHREQPDKVFAVFGDDGETWTYAQLREFTLQTALGLRQLGVRQGDHVLVWLPNSREALRVFFAVNYLGAVFACINTAYKGALLAHVIDNADARVAVIHGDLLARLHEVPTGRLDTVVVVGPKTSAPAPLKTLRYEEALLPNDGTLAAPPRPTQPWDPFALIYTSGTTGPSKGVYCSYLHLYSNAGPETWPFVTRDDRYLINMPMFHIGGMGGTYVMFARGASISFVERFDTAGFWKLVRDTQTTVAFLLGVMATFPPASE